jgi:hypothetical protein
MFKHKTAYEIYLGDWSSDVCSSDLVDGTSVSHTTVGLGNKYACSLDLYCTPRRRVSSVKLCSKFCTLQMIKLIIT